MSASRSTSASSSSSSVPRGGNPVSKNEQKVNCCGSIFKNPPGYNAWKLIKSSIDESFYKGPIKLSKKHSNFFENDPNINSDMIILFINQIRERVYKKYNINLEPELEIK